jgi:hypothetical protein
LITAKLPSLPANIMRWHHDKPEDDNCSPMYMIVNLAMGAKNFEGVGFVDAKSPATVEFQIDRISAYQLDLAANLGREADAR